MKYQVGQQVQIVSKTPSSAKLFFNVKEMSKYLGKKAIIDRAYNSYSYYLKGIPGIRNWMWLEDWLTPIIPSRTELNKALLNGEITLEQFQEGLKDVENII